MAKGSNVLQWLTFACQCCGRSHHVVAGHLGALSTAKRRHKDFNFMEDPFKTCYAPLPNLREFYPRLGVYASPEFTANLVHIDPIIFERALRRIYSSGSSSKNRATTVSTQRT